MVTAILARNEGDRYLDRVIRHHRRWGPVLVLDDQSTDNSREVARAAGAELRIRTGATAWGHESPARQELWEWGAEVAGDGWLLISDADHLLIGDPLPLCTSWVVNTWAFCLFDTWDSEELHRSDGYWAGYKHPRPWLFKPSAVPEGWTAAWGERGIHSGHCPINLPMVVGTAPADTYLVHLGWMRDTDRAAKYLRYRSVWESLSPFERSHAESIIEV